MEGQTLLVVTTEQLKGLVHEAVREYVGLTAMLAPAEEEPATYTRTEVQRILQVSLTTLSNWAKSGYLPVVKIGRQARYRKSDIQRIINNRP